MKFENLEKWYVSCIHLLAMIKYYLLNVKFFLDINIYLYRQEGANFKYFIGYIFIIKLLFIDLTILSYLDFIICILLFN